MAVLLSLPADDGTVTGGLPAFRSDCHNALAVPMQSIQVFARARRAGVYMLTQPWNTYAVTSYKNEVHLLAVKVDLFAIVVINRDEARTHGRPYRIRVSSATVTRINKVNGEHDFDPVDGFTFAPEGCERVIRVADRITYETSFNSNPLNLRGRGFYVSPSYKEAMKVLVYIMRYNNRRLEQLKQHNGVEEHHSVPEPAHERDELYESPAQTEDYTNALETALETEIDVQIQSLLDQDDDFPDA